MAEEHLSGRQIDRGALQVIRGLRDAGFETYLVGGAVRDMLLGILPKDFDIATSATPEEIKRVFGRQAMIIGKRFQICHVRRGDDEYEVSTFRRTPSERERKARHSDDGTIVWRDNEWGSMEDDAMRRDFTCNALYLDPLDDNRILDLATGVDDVRRRIVRSLGDPHVRFAEDPVRMLRALKLVSHYGFALEAEVEAAIREHAQKMDLVSKRRLFEELIKLIYKPFLARTLDVCHHHGLLRYILPAADEIMGSPDAETYFHLLADRDEVMAQGRSRSRVLSLALLAYPWVEFRMNPQGRLGQHWGNFDAMDRVCRDAITEFFEPLPITRELSSRTRDILLMQKPILEGRGGRFHAHPDFRYALLAFEILAPRLKWCPREEAQRLIEEADEDSSSEGRRSRGSASRRKSRSRRPQGSGEQGPD